MRAGRWLKNCDVCARLQSNNCDVCVRLQQQPRVVTRACMYTSIGGASAVIYTEVMQTVVLITGGLCVLGV